jgi:hypothetical protein
MQVRLAHGWFGEYYARIGVPEDDECPCTAWRTAAGDTSIRPIVETREHILLHCPLYAAARARHFHNVLTDKIMSLPVILGTAHRDIKLCAFLRETNAFFKQRRPRQPP